MVKWRDLDDEGRTLAINEIKRLARIEPDEMVRSGLFAAADELENPIWDEGPATPKEGVEPWR